MELEVNLLASGLDHFSLNHLQSVNVTSSNVSYLINKFQRSLSNQHDEWFHLKPVNKIVFYHRQNYHSTTGSSADLIHTFFQGNHSQDFYSFF